MTKHLYIHIPFCNQICSFCDFTRTKTNNLNLMESYVDKIINQVKLTSTFKQYKTIYLGGGTPNHLSNPILEKLLKHLSLYLDDKYEFTIECNPDLITHEQATIFKHNKINRVSIGVQSLNNEVLKKMGRTHNVNDVICAINILQSHHIDNISCDFIYNLPDETKKDLQAIQPFLVKHHIKHVSIYALELKQNSLLSRNNHKINQDIEEEKWELIKNMMSNQFKRYEVSNWATNSNYYSQHNLAYWKSNDWKAIGYGSCGFEKQHYYEIKGNNKNWFCEQCEYLSPKDYYYQIMIMGLRLTQGIDLTQKQNKKAYLFFKDKLDDNKEVIIENNFLKIRNIDLLDDLLISLLD